MNTRTTKSLLWVTATLFAGLIAATVLWVWLTPVAVPDAVQNGGAMAVSTDPSHDPTQPAWKDYAKVVEIELRRPLYDPPPAPPPPPPAKPALTIKLTGVILDPGRELAVFQTRSGSVEMVGIGQRIEKARLISIKQGGVVVEYLGEQVQLSLSDDGGQP